MWDRLRQSLTGANPAGGLRHERTSGLPNSSNGASSMHVQWLGVPSDAVAVEVDLTITTPPASQHLHFWALQASFMSGNETHGAGHLGLQWIDGYPGNTAVNWGGYHHGGGGELDGSPSMLPSSRGNVNTRDYAWREGRAYRLRITRGSDGWIGEVTDSETGIAIIVRELYCPGERLGNIVMWSEVFAPCEGPSSSIEWSEPRVETSEGIHEITEVKLSYQSVADGGCSNTASSPLVARRGIEQRTATPRGFPHGAILPL